MKRPIIIAARGAFERASLRAILKDLEPGTPLRECRDADETRDALAGLGQGFAVIEETLVEDSEPALRDWVQRLGSRCIILERGPAGTGTPIGRWARLLPDWLATAKTAFCPPTRDMRIAPADLSREERTQPAMSNRSPACVLVASSTGGPSALASLLTTLPGGDLPWVVAQHMPEHGTGAFAQHLRETTGRAVSEAAAGRTVQPGEILILAGGQDFGLARRDDGSLMLRQVRSVESPFHPNADCLLQSVATLNLPCIALVLSGMGSDGALGAARLAAAGNPVFVQDPRSCVVPGMPQAAMELVPDAVTFDPARPPAALINLVAARQSRE